jgi:hypothetical protein
MNRLSLIKRRSFLSFYLSVFFFSQLSVAGNSTGAGTIDMYEYDMKHKNEDAYYIFTKTELVLTNKILSLPENTVVTQLTSDKIMITTTIHQKLKINTKTGVDNYAFIYINKDIYSHIKSLEVSTVKPDGSVMLMDSTHIFNIKIESDENEIQKVNQMRFAIPGVEAGDVIDIIYTVLEEDVELNNQFANVFMQRELSSASSTFSISVPRPYTIFYKCYNRFPDPVVEVSDKLVNCVFKLNNLQAVKPNQYSCLPCNLPYFYFSLEYNKQTITTKWKDIYYYVFNYLTKPLNNDPENFYYYERWAKKIYRCCEDSSKYYVLKLLMADIRDNMKIKNLGPDEQFKSAGYYLKKGYIDPINIRRLYRQILTDLHIDYWAAFGRNKWAGPIDSYFIRKNEISDIFFVYTDENNKMSYLYPHNEYYKYEINELPTYLYNTKAVIVKRAHSSPYIMGSSPSNYGTIFDDSVIVQTIELSAGNKNTNYLKQLITYHSDFSLSNDTFNAEFIISGGVSTKYRQVFSFLHDNEEVNQLYQSLFDYKEMGPAFRIDTVIKRELTHEQPFKYKAVGLGTINKGITKISDSIISISLNEVIFHDQVDTETGTAESDYLLDYAYTDILQLFISFSEPFEILNQGDLNRTITNETGEYTCKINTLSENSISITSEYCINKDYIKKDEYRLVADINNMINEIKNSRLMIKMQ